MKQLKKLKGLFYLAVSAWAMVSFNSVVAIAQNQDNYCFPKQITIENFDDGMIDLTSFPVEDEEPLGWELNSAITFENSPWSLKLSGNTWKVQDISPVTVDSGDVWQVSSFIVSKAEIQGFAVMDSAHVLFYSFAGTEMVNIEEWVPVYQGFFEEEKWNSYQLPIAEDWLAFYDYLPEITAVVYINDKDGTSQGEVYFDNIINISEDLPHIPKVSIEYSIAKVYTDGGGSKFADVQFISEVIDPDSEEHDFLWDFGDDSSSTEQNPLHTFLITDDHPYSVLLRVVDSTNRWGQASCSVEIEPGNSSFPVTINFVGDIMLARRYENSGGIIPTQGVESIFEPTLQFLGNAADITVANLECPLTTYWEHHPTKSIYFKGSPENVDGLTFAGIDIVSLANNHILDYMYPGMEETQEVLKENNILYTGAGANSYEAYLPAFYSKSGVNFAFLAASDRTGQYVNQQPYLDAGYNKPGFANLVPWYIKKQINEVKGISDLVVLEWHTGIEYSMIPTENCDTCPAFSQDIESDENYFPLALTPDPKDRATTHFAIDNGADLVICHHPHMIQGLELYNGKLIAHSLGNFAFDQEYPETYPSFILNSKVDEKGFYEFTLTPVYIDDYIPRRADGGLGLHILDDLAQRSKDLDTYLEIDRDSVIAIVIMDTNDIQKSITEISTQLLLEEAGNVLKTPPHTLSRTGSITTVDSILPNGNYEFRLGRELIWFGNMEDEGCTLWNLNSSQEGYCDTVAFASGRSIQHLRTENSSSNIITNFEERIICPSDTMKYSLGGYIKTRNGANVTIEILYYTNRTGIVPLDVENIGLQITGDTPWTFYHRELTIPPGTQFFDIRMNSGIPDSDSAFSWFDDVSLIRWENWAAYDIAQAIPAPNDYYFIQIQSIDNAGEILLTYSETGYGIPELPLKTALKVFLEGPFNGTDMNTCLTGISMPGEGLPLSQPYSTPPWNYDGTESVDTIPTSEIVDWILIEFRDAPDAAGANEASVIDRQAVFLLRDGSVVGTDGSSPVQFNGTITELLFAVIRHRNHVDIISSNPLIKTGDIYAYDFTSSFDLVYGGEAGYKSLAPGIYGMAGGDTDADGMVDFGDIMIWEISSGKTGYFPADMNLNGQVNNPDKNDIWFFNNGFKTSQVPE